MHQPPDPYIDSKYDLPNASLALALGVISPALAIISLGTMVLPLFAFRTNLPGLAGVVCGGIALYMHASGKALYEQEPGRYTDTSMQRLRLGRVFGLVGIILHFLTFAWIILMLALAD